MSESKKTQEALARIEETLGALCSEVGAIRERVDKLDRPARKTGQMTTDELIEFFDQYRAAEAMAEAAFGAWIEVSDTPCLRGALRVIQTREGSHARLFEQRIKELGGSPKAEVDTAAEEFFMSYGARDKSDAEKVDSFVKAAGDPKILDQLEAQAQRMNHDEESQFLLRAVIEDERASLAMIHQAHELLCGS